MSHEERIRKADAFHPGASYPGVLSPIGRGNEDGILI